MVAEQAGGEVVRGRSNLHDTRRSPRPAQRNRIVPEDDVDAHRVVRLAVPTRLLLFDEPHDRRELLCELRVRAGGQCAWRPERTHREGEPRADHGEAAHRVDSAALSARRQRPAFRKADRVIRRAIRNNQSRITVERPSAPYVVTERPTFGAR